MNTSSPLVVFHLDFNYVNLRSDYLRRWLEKIAGMGYNAVLWEIENKVRWETCPECVWPEAMSKEEFRELLDYSRSLGLEPIPLMQTIGHAEYVLLHEPYHAFRELPDRHDCYCTSKPEVRELLCSWVEEYLELFGPLRYFHLGGDEAYVFGQCPECSARIATSSANALYAEHVTAIAQPLLRAGIRPGVWCDMLLHYPTEVNCLSPEFIIWDWNYWDGCATPEQTRVWHCQRLVSKAEAVSGQLQAELPELFDSRGDLRPFHTVDLLQRAGREIILCSASRSGGDSYFVPCHAVHADNIAAAAAKAKAAGLLGTCVTSWAIRQNSFETQEWLLQLAPAVMASSELPQGVLDRVIPESVRQSLNRIATFDPRLLTLSAIMWNTLKDALPAPAGHTAATIAIWKAENNPFWTNRIDILKSALSTVERGLGELQADASAVAAAWIEAGRLQQRFYQVMLLLFGRSPDRPAAIPALESLRHDFIGYLEQSQTPLSARQNAGLVVDPLLEYADKK